MVLAPSCRVPETEFTLYRAATSLSKRTVRSPETVLFWISSGVPVVSTKTSPETPSEENRRMAPEAVMSPETVCALTRPVWSRIETSPLTVLMSRSPVTESTTTSPVTVLMRASVVKPEMSAEAEMTPNFRATSRGTMRLMSARALPRHDLKTSMKLSHRNCG